MPTLVSDESYSSISCYKCQFIFYVPTKTKSRWQEKHTRFVCPSCEAGQAFHSDTEAERLRRELEEAELRAKRNYSYYEQEQRRVSAMKGQVTKLKKRAAHGVCACCNRTFANVATHMAQKHPDFVQDAQNQKTNLHTLAGKQEAQAQPKRGRPRKNA